MKENYERYARFYQTNDLGSFNYKYIYWNSFRDLSFQLFSFFVVLLGSPFLFFLVFVGIVGGCGLLGPWGLEGEMVWVNISVRFKRIC